MPPEATPESTPEAKGPKTRAAAKTGLAAVFALPNDDTRKILAVALALCLVCSVVVSGAAVALKPLQERNAALALKREILRVANLLEAETDVDSAFSRIETRLVDLDTGAYVDSADPLAYSYRDAGQDPTTSEALGGADIAGIRRRPSLMPVYLVRDGEALQTVILPVYGYGLWSTMHGLLALAPDGRTVQSLSFYEQRETAGLGGEVANPDWQAGWQGKEIRNAQGQPVITVVKGSVDADAPEAMHQIDGLSGATLTANGVTNLMTFWLGAQGFGPYLDRLAKGEA